MANAEEKVTYEYNKLKNEIYAKSENELGVLKFQEDYTGNPAYSFGYFTDYPAIIVDGRALHDSTVYATLKYSKGSFQFSCLYFSIKSKRNGISTKEGACELNMSLSENYLSDIENRTSDLENKIDAIDTSLLLNGNVPYLPIILHNDKEKLIYKVYNKELMLNDKYFILSLKNNGSCEVYDERSWVIYSKGNKKGIKLMSEEIINGKIELKAANPISIDNEECFSHPVFNVKSRKAFFYDSLFNAKKSYLVKGDNFNLLSMSNDGKWCNINYINNKNKITNGNLLCSDLSLPLEKRN